MKSKKCDAVALGELLVDFSHAGESERGNWLFEANAGGAPCNVLAMLSRLGWSTQFVGKVGDDLFGHMLAAKVSEAGVGTKHLAMSGKRKTTLAFVKNASDGERDFSFYRKGAADLALHKSDVSAKAIASSRVFHFGTLSMTADPALSVTQWALRVALKRGCIVSFDPNYRRELWQSEKQARKAILYGAAVCHVMKIADDELEFATGKSDIKGGVLYLKRHCDNLKLVTVTLGKKGAAAFFFGEGEGGSAVEAFAPAFDVAAVDTTGAGDAFAACVLDEVLDRGLDGFDVPHLTSMLSFAQAASALVVGKRGALLSMPDRSEVGSFLKAHIGTTPTLPVG